METKFEFKNMGYCGAECGNKCHIFTATVSNDIDAKKRIASDWAFEQGESFTTDEVFCYGCKNKEMPQNKAHLKCTVRICAEEKHLEACFQCKDLEKCDKALWRNWPNLKSEALRIQKSLNL